MAGNTYKIKNGSGKGSVFSRLESSIKLESFFSEGVPVQVIPRILFLTAIGIFYIGNRHYAEKTIRKINTLETRVEDLRADFTTLKADYMFESKQSEVARRAEKLGLKELVEPHTKIRIPRE